MHYSQNNSQYQFQNNPGALKVIATLLQSMNISNNNAKQKHLGCKKGEANQKQQLSDYKSIHSYTCD